MKSLKNKKTEISKGENEFTTYIDLAKVCIDNIPPGGLDEPQMIARFDVEDALKDSNGEIKFTTKAQLETLKECVKSMRWNMRHKDILSFIEDVKKL